MNATTELAIDAYRKHANLLRRADNAEAALRKILNDVPSEELPEYWRRTEIIRLDLERRAAQENHDQEASDFCTLRIAELNGQVTHEG